MKHAWLLALLLLLPAAAAQTYTLYGQGDVDVPEGTLHFTFTERSDAGLAEAVDIYTAVKKSGTDDQVNQALNLTRSALSDAKRDDALIVETPWNSLIIPYKECKHADKYVICFDSSIYYEEDVSPLGDGRLDSVKYENGSTLIPFAVVVEESTVTLSGQRTLNVTQTYPGESVKVTTLITNTGRETADSVSLEEDVPLTVKNGQTKDFVGSLEPDGTLQIQYVVDPTTPGEFIFHGTVTSSDGSVDIPDSTLVVLAPLTVAMTAENGYTGRLTPVEVTITNTYRASLDVRSFTLSGSETASLTSFNNTTKRASDKIPLFTLPSGGSVRLTYNVLGDAAGEQSLIATASFQTNKLQTASAQATYTRTTPSLLATVATDGGLVRVVLSNKGLPTVDSLQVKFPDGYVKTVASFKSDAQATVEYTPPSGVLPASVSVSYAHPITGKPINLLLQVPGVSAPSVPASPDQPASETPPPGTPTESAPPAQEPVSQPSAPSTDAGEQAPSREVPPTSDTNPPGLFARLTASFVNLLERVFG